MVTPPSATGRKKPQSRGPKRRDEPARPAWLVSLAVLGLVLVGALLFALTRTGTESTTAGGLPDAPDYHSLLVSPTDSRSLALGTHDGLFRSADGGLTWKAAELGGQDAMNLARAGDEVVWAAGHNMLARSDDGGATWADVRPSGLPGLDVHAFAVDPQDSRVVYAAIAGQGLHRSGDAGATFERVSTEVGAGVMALVVLSDGTLLAGDMERKALVVSSDDGKTWSSVIDAQIMGLAVNPSDEQRILASGPGVLLTTDGGKTWRQTLNLDAGTGPIAWAPNDPSIAYVVGFDRTLYRSNDDGATWKPVEGDS